MSNASAPSTPSAPACQVDYTESELAIALASLASNEDGDASKRDHDCGHIYGYQHQGNNNEKDGSFFENGHKLSKLQQITATRILDYRALLADPKTASEETLLSQASKFQTKHGPTVNLLTQIQSQSPSMALAAEFKRASPSKGDIAPNLHAGTQATLYTQAGASIISVLTETRSFKGTLLDLTQARIDTTVLAGTNTNTTSHRRPAILRKDFCISTYMIAEAAASGADSILLIVAITPRPLLAHLISYARETCRMEPLVEVHAPEELDVALDCGARVIGVNNRNLHTFTMDLATTEKTAVQLRQRGCVFGHDHSGSTDAGAAPSFALCALSGMSTAQDVHRYRRIGVGMVLIGESLMRAADPTAAIQSLCLDPAAYSAQTALTSSSTSLMSAYVAGTKLVKVCGITNAHDAKLACAAGANLIGVIFASKSKRCVSVNDAKEVVEVVRKFGERSARVDLDVDGTVDSKIKGWKPLPSLVVKARALEEASTRRPLVVGVFQNQSREFIQSMVEECGLDLVQLHGQEGMEAASVEYCGVPAIRVVDVETKRQNAGENGVQPQQEQQQKQQPPSTLESVPDQILNAITTDPVAILLDTSIKGSKEGGGTGVTFDWTIAEKLQNSGLPVIIAGGLKPTNVKDAVGKVRPWGIDVSSGVEACPGKKDAEAVMAFVSGAREAAIEASKGF